MKIDTRFLFDDFMVTFTQTHNEDVLLKCENGAFITLYCADSL